MSQKIILFHGGCHECTLQEERGTDDCRKCQYFDADWSLPNLNNKDKTQADLVKEEIKEAFNC